jgi:hypothetical protein
MQQRESRPEPRSPLDALLSRTDEAAIDYITDRLLDETDLDAPPEPGDLKAAPILVAAG